MPTAQIKNWRQLGIGQIPSPERSESCYFIKSGLEKNDGNMSQTPNKLTRPPPGPVRNLLLVLQPTPPPIRASLILHYRALP